MNRLVQPAIWLFLGVWLVLLIGGRTRFFQDPGTFWHVAVGDRILADGFFDQDPYTFTFAGKEWIPHQWLGECAMALVNRLSGFDGLLLATATILAATYAGLGVRLTRAGFHPSVAAVLIAGAIAASSGHFHVRPHLATIVGMAVFMVYLTDVDNRRLPIARLSWLIPVTWLWANPHGGVLGGLATFGLAIAGWTAARVIRHDSPITSWREFGMVVLIWLACAGVCVLNPYFHRLPASWVEIYQMKSLPTIIKEHSRLDPSDWTGMTVLGFGAVYCLLLVTVPVRRIRVVWLLPVVWLVLAWMRVRHAPLFAVLALVGIADLFPATRFAAALVRRKSDLFVLREPDADEPLARAAAWPFAVTALVVALSLLVQVAGLAVPVVGRGWARLDPAVWPVEMLPELKAHQYDRPRGTRIFNEYAYGGFLIHHCPGYRVFVDDRCEVFGDEFLVHFVQTRAQLQLGLYDDPAEPFANWQARYGPFDFALVETGGGFDVALGRIPAWEVVRRTKTATFYRKSAGAK